MHAVPSCQSALPPSVPDCELSPQLVAVAEFTVRPSVAELVWAGVLESMTWNVSELAFAVAVGVPVIAPVEGLSVSPAGSVPLVNDQV